jgi:hypothetical protein
MTTEKISLISKKRIFFTLILSLVNALLATLNASIYWPAIEVERLFFAGFLSPIFWLLFVFMGFLARDTKRAVIWQVGLILLQLAMASWAFI